ncbi:hypothetical protein L1987_53883 [Smallanthus sonchifolius]|uniref:Uncharacterized protein n=1 Tax=Smallanthus sonchifolius TaxID=185202 RepID=A0ACB9EWS9_9ASTR|nr:hypothetical protein L1987_53883 [Smallanthus sonchifolius]
MEIEVSSTFELEKAVCNHGFFMMAPNRWIPSTKTLVRPLRLPDNNKSVTVSISQSCPTFISVSILDNPLIISTSPILDQVKRMLRLSEKEEEAVKEFHRLHADAANKGFGRLFRNPSLFEDIVKTCLLCACRFKDSLEMAERLCRLNPKRKRGRRKEGDLNFPTAHQVSKMDRSKMKKILGYRCDVVLDLAKDVTSGKINLDHLEHRYSNGDDLYQHLRKIKGIGDFVSSNILMCLGFYHRLPVDSETIRHIKQVTFELVEYYESKVGKLGLLEKADYKSVAGSFLNKRTSNSIQI